MRIYSSDSCQYPKFILLFKNYVSLINFRLRCFGLLLVKIGDCRDMGKTFLMWMSKLSF